MHTHDEKAVVAGELANGSDVSGICPELVSHLGRCEVHAGIRRSLAKSLNHRPQTGVPWPEHDGYMDELVGWGHADAASSRKGPDAAGNRTVVRSDNHG